MPVGNFPLVNNAGYKDPRFKGLCHACGSKYGKSWRYALPSVEGRCNCCGELGRVSTLDWFGNPEYPSHPEFIA